MGGRARALAMALGAAALLGIGPGRCAVDPGLAREGDFEIVFLRPLPAQLSLAGPVPVEIRLIGRARKGEVALAVDGAAVDLAGFELAEGSVRGTLPALAAGTHRIEVAVDAPRPGWSRWLPWLRWLGRGGPQDRFEASSGFELVELDRPGSCEPLNQVECVLPFPSSRFLEPADTATGYRVVYAEDSLPVVGRFSGVVAPLDPAPFLENDGFSPTVQVLMHFPGGFDPERSGAARLLPDTRSYDERSLEPDSPTLLIDLDTGERVLHWVENDDRSLDPSRRVTFLRPGRSLTPGHRYAVVVRNIVNSSGEPVEPEPLFRALRDGRPIDIPEIHERARAFWRLAQRLRRHRIQPRELVLAFDFVVQSDHSLTWQMLSMRDQALADLDTRMAAYEASGDPARLPFVVDEVTLLNPGCADPDLPIWKDVRGRFAVPLFLSADPFVQPKVQGRLLRDADGRPLPAGTTWAPYGVVIPCSVFEAGFTPRPPLLVGHGLFGTGASTVSGLARAEGFSEFGYVAGATNWAGLSGPDVTPPPSIADLTSFIASIFTDFDRFGALPDRLRQGQANTLVLARLLREGLFNEHPEFQNEAGLGVIQAGTVGQYFGASLGGIMGGMTAALSDDLLRMNLDVPAINFSLLLSRATPFLPFELLLDLLVPDRMRGAIGIGLLHEQWVRGESACCAGHVTRDPLPGSREKQILLTVALYDQQVSNLGSQLMGASYGLRALEGSVLRGLAGVPDASGPQPSAYVVYDTGGLDPVTTPTLVPPLTNRQAQPSRCDPHGLRGFIPASIAQLQLFLDEGVVENFCSDDGVCNASEPFELPFGAEVPCQP